MSAFFSIQAAFGLNWTTVLVGWEGLGVFSPWPSRWTEFPSLVSAEEVAVYADERLASATALSERDLVLKLVSVDWRTESREAIRDLLKPLSDFDGKDPAIELRKWRLVLLERVLENMPQDSLYGLMALTEFWQGFGFPPDGPHQVQARGNEIGPKEYYTAENFREALDRHRQWIEKEAAELLADRGVRNAQ